MLGKPAFLYFIIHSMSAEHYVSDNRIGSIAKKWLSHPKQVQVFGTTSSGIFLHLNDGYKTVYMSNYPDFGPININLKSELPNSWKKSKQIKIAFSDGELSLDGKTYNNFTNWETKAAMPFNITPDTFNERTQKAAKQLVFIKGDHGFTKLIPKLAGNSNKIQTDLNPVWENIKKTKAALINQDVDSFIQAVKPLISYGRGLTPSGDDFLCGLIYCLVRKDAQNIFTPTLLKSKETVLEIAKKQTTSISTSLLACSFEGEAHSRIEEITEALTHQETEFNKQALRMAGWGSSSGADTTLGIILAAQLMLGL